MIDAIAQPPMLTIPKKIFQRAVSPTQLAGLPTTTMMRGLGVRAFWQANRVSIGALMTDGHRELLECLSRGRIGIQEIYAQLNLKPGSSSQGNMARHAVQRGNVATLVFVVSLTLAGMWILLRQSTG